MIATSQQKAVATSFLTTLTARVMPYFVPPIVVPIFLALAVAGIRCASTL